MGYNPRGHKESDMTERLSTARIFGASQVAQQVKNSLAMQENWVRSLGREDPLGMGTTTHSSSLAWKIP